jgi:ABC-type multidrug transport system ATPase subunit
MRLLHVSRIHLHREEVNLIHLYQCSLFQNCNKKLKVAKVIQQMGVKNVADSRIGSSIIRGISGVEQRRVTIAIQLLKDPGN